MILKETVVKGPNGFGFTLKDSDTGFQTIIRIEEGSNNGLEVGDLLLSIEGLGLRGMTHDQIVERIRSFPPESTAQLTISRPKTHPLFRRYRGPNKDDIRSQVWTLMEETNLVEFPRPCYQRIPNFRGARNACEKLLGLDCFRKAFTVKVNPDKPQEVARFLALQFNKKLLVPTPRLRHGLFNHVLPPLGFGAPDLKFCVNAEGVKHYGIPIPLKSNIEVDLIVVGSVAVSEKGYRIGKGEGFADMEWGMMATMGAVHSKTIVVTIVHDCQVREIPDELIEPHDITVDIILTPRRIIYCPGRLPRPNSLIWDKITPDKMREIPSLTTLVEIARKRGLTVKLPQDNNINSNHRHRRNRSAEVVRLPYRDPHEAYQNGNYAQQARRSYSANGFSQKPGRGDFGGNNNGSRGRRVQRQLREQQNNAGAEFHESSNWNYGQPPCYDQWPQNLGQQFYRDGGQSFHQNGQSLNAGARNGTNGNRRPVAPRLYKREPARRGGRGGVNNFHNNVTNNYNNNNNNSGVVRGGGGRGNRRAPRRLERVNRRIDGPKNERRLGSIKEEEEKEEENTEEEEEDNVQGEAISGEGLDAASSPMNQRVRKDHRREQRRSIVVPKSPKSKSDRECKETVADTAIHNARVLDIVVEAESNADKPEGHLNASNYNEDSAEKLKSKKSASKRGIEPLMELSFGEDKIGCEDDILDALVALEIAASTDVDSSEDFSDAKPFVHEERLIASAAASSAASSTASSAASSAVTATTVKEASSLISSFSSSHGDSTLGDSTLEDSTLNSDSMAVNISRSDECDGEDAFQEAKGDLSVARPKISHGKCLPETAPKENEIEASDSDSDSSTSSSDSVCLKVMTPSIKSANSEIFKPAQPMVDSETESEDDDEVPDDDDEVPDDDDDDDGDDELPSVKESLAEKGLSVEDVKVVVAGEVPEVSSTATKAQSITGGVACSSLATASNEAANAGKAAPKKSRIFGKVYGLLKTTK